MALLNSKVTMLFLSVLAPTMDYSQGPVSKIPYFDTNEKQRIEELVRNSISISSKDWNSFEIAWDYDRNPLANRGLSRGNTNSDSIKIEECYKEWSDECDRLFDQLKSNEEEINRIFINIYKLQDELTPIVDEKDVTVRRADLRRDIKYLLSYAVGCMFGRYSLLVPGLVFAGGEWPAYEKSIGIREKYFPLADPSICSWMDVYGLFVPDIDNVIPITDEEYLEDDIVSRLCTFLKVVFGEGVLEENLDYIAKALGNKGDSSREIIRNYFLTDFFKDHCQTYSVTGSGKRPIYWLFDSGKQNGFKALIYLHRYNADTIGNLRIDYLHRMQRIYESEINRMQDMIDHSTNAREIGQATKRKDKLTKQLKECREYDEKLAHLALSRIELDLDDGVKVNYRKLQTANDGKFYEVLADSKNIMAKK